VSTAASRRTCHERYTVRHPPRPALRQSREPPLQRGARVLGRDVGIRFNGKDKTNVEEYCVSEGWIRVAAGKAKDRYGNPLTIKLTGKVEPYFKNAKEVKDAKED
jgi:hypothetical protein